MENNIGMRLKDLRGERSQRAFADMIGCSQTSYSGWEVQGKEPGANAIRLICLSCGVSADWLLGIGSEKAKVLVNGPVSNSITASPNSQVVESTRLLDIIEKQQAKIERQQDTILQLTDKISSLATNGKE